MQPTLLIGVDGGATEAKAHAVACDDLAAPASFQLRPESAGRVYPRLTEFAPLPVPQQLAARDAGDLQISAAEAEQARLWVEAAAEAVIEVARQCAAQRVLVGVGMPGLKTPDGRGIHVINNGPRIPQYLDRLQHAIAAAGFELIAPIAALGSDADYCGLGEEYAAGGLFRDVQNAYYLGGGTGIADALKLRGRLVPFDQAKTWIRKSWQMPSGLGPTFERFVSASALNRVWADLNGPGTAGRQPDYPELAATSGEWRAIAWLDVAALVLAELIFERLWTIKHGRASAPHRGPAYAQLDPNHEFRGTLLDRVILGQRVGLIYADSRFRSVFADKLDAHLASFIATSGDPALELKAGFLRASRLRAAPALGAAIAAARAVRT